MLGVPERLQAIDGLQVHTLCKGQSVNQSVQLWRLVQLVQQALTGLLELTLRGEAREEGAVVITTYTHPEATPTPD